MLPQLNKVRIKIQNHRPQALHLHHLQVQVHLQAGEVAVVAVQAVAAVKNQS